MLTFTASMESEMRTAMKLKKAKRRRRWTWRRCQKKQMQLWIVFLAVDVAILIGQNAQPETAFMPTLPAR